MSYSDVLRALLPLDLGEDAAKERDLDGATLDAAQKRGLDLLAEMLPDTSTELLDDWERVLGLPDSCVGGGGTIQERRAAAVAKYVGRGGQSRAYFIALAASLGYAITITEFRQFRVGASRVGDPLCGDDWRFVWRVTAQDFTIQHFRVGSSAVGEPLRSWGNEILECAIRRVAPAHTQVVFGYLETQGGLDVVLGGESVTIGGQTVNISGVL